MMNAIVASNLTHARAMIGWMSLNEDEWMPLAYGTPVENLLFKNVYLVRPHEGIRYEHGDWFVAEIMPRTAGKIETLPRGYRPQDDPAQEEEVPDIAAG